MNKKEELSEQYRRKAYEVSPTRKRCQHNNEVIAWNNEIVGAFESGWDAALKDLQSRFPKWKKEAPSATTLYVKYKDYYLEVKAVEWLFDLLGKEE